MPTTTTPNALRDTITKAYRMDEAECINFLIPQATLSPTECAHIAQIATQLVANTREYKKKQSKLDTLLHQYDLSTEEGIALMCLAEALLRIPDKTTIDKFIGDKISTADWKNHLDGDNPLFVNAATWSLLISGKIYSPTLDTQRSLGSTLKRTTSKLGIAVIRPAILQMMKAIGKQFVMGEDIEAALKRATKQEAMGYRFSYDMLGEAARTQEDAKHYYDSYVTAIRAIGSVAHADSPAKNPGISIKLSALHPRYEFAQYDEVMQTLPPLLLTLAQQAKQYNIGLTVDAEEADRLDLSLDIFEKIYSDPTLANWEGLGLAVQAYQKRASFVIDWLADLASHHQKRIMVRLVKGAYWDAEIKTSQVHGFSNYPVFTRKNATDVSYLACAQKLLNQAHLFYSQFGTHNAYTVAAILEMGKNQREHYEFQCLHGMGRPLYDQIVSPQGFNTPCRIYAPVGTHRDLLGYLVRRLLENGANSSFVNRLADESIPVEQIIIDPVARMAALAHKPHPRIPLPRDIYGHWENSTGIDLSNRFEREQMQAGIQTTKLKEWIAMPLVDGELKKTQPAQAVLSPSTLATIGHVYTASKADVDEALDSAYRATATWGNTPVQERAQILERAAALFQEAMPQFIAYLTQEGGKCIPDSIAEIRETIDYCRYYAYRARHDFQALNLPSPTGETNQLTLHPRGMIACISPWNFPLAIFSGQIIAALAAGNTVLAKPAEQTPLIAFEAVRILHRAGVPTNALQLLPGSGSDVGAQLVSDPRVAAVMFTGSTETAKLIERALANRASGQIAALIAETGGQNAMIVDSSALLEQAVFDIAQSAFNSAGQRCSALRVLFVQEDIADNLISMLKGYMQTLQMGDPSLLSTDIGPVIDHDAKQMLERHFSNMMQAGKLVAQVALKGSGGHYFAPCAFEIPDLVLLKGEVFGPILHIIRYQSNELDKVMEAIIKTGFGLTLGVHSRIDATIRYITERMPVGNMYVNRNMIGAVVGVQPFGGERLSGTGPKAGGPHYLPRLCVERCRSTNTTAVGGNARLVSLLEDEG